MNHPFYKHVRKTATTEETFFMSHLDFSGNIISDFMRLQDLQEYIIVASSNDEFIEEKAKAVVREKMLDHILSKCVLSIKLVGDYVARKNYNILQKFIYNNFGFEPVYRWSKNQDLSDYINERSCELLALNGHSKANFAIIPSSIADDFQEIKSFEKNKKTDQGKSILNELGKLYFLDHTIEVFVIDDSYIGSNIILGSSFENSSMLDKIVMVEGPEEFKFRESLQGPEASIPHRLFVYQKKICVSPLTGSELCFISFGQKRKIGILDSIKKIINGK